MAFVRIVNPAHYDRRQGKFKNYAFKNSSTDGGASVFELACALSVSGSICSHIEHFYKGVGGKPPAYWVFELSNIQPSKGAAILCRQTISKSGDECHHNVEGASNGHLRRIAESWTLNDINFCAEGGLRILTLADTPEPSEGITD